MRLITRSDFDGIACAVLLREINVINEILFVHPSDVQRGYIGVTSNDCVVNVPYIKGCGLWFDNHVSEEDRFEYGEGYNGVFKPSPSCARIIYDYFGGERVFYKYNNMINAVDRVTSGNLTMEDIFHPRGYIMLGYILDPRTGFGRFHDFMTSNYQLMLNSVEYCRNLHINSILSIQDMQERLILYKDHTELFKDMILRNSTIRGNLVITDLRNEPIIYTGNRYIVNALFPEQDIFMMLTRNKGNVGTVCSVGKSVVNLQNPLCIGTMMYKHGGGGNNRAGAVQFTDEESVEGVENVINDILGIVPEKKKEPQKQKKKLFNFGGFKNAGKNKEAK